MSQDSAARPVLGRYLSLASQCAAEGDHERARSLVQLAIDTASPQEIEVVVAAADQVLEQVRPAQGGPRVAATVLEPVAGEGAEPAPPPEEPPAPVETAPPPPASAVPPPAAPPPRVRPREAPTPRRPRPGWAARPLVGAVLAGGVIWFGIIFAMGGPDDVVDALGQLVGAVLALL